MVGEVGLRGWLGAFGYCGICLTWRYAKPGSVTTL